MQTKKCKRCQEIKPLDKFWKQTNKGDNLRPNCQACCQVLRKKYPEKKATYDKRLRRERSLRKVAYRYNISEEELEKKFKESDGLCEICKKPETAVTNCKTKTKRLSVDHCHTTGTFRGLLCGKCNTALGTFKDSIENLENAISYLKKSKNE